ncbi:hypothetical protein Sdia_34730 [Streptomyces diastaticus subsp. diastaticus]|uniref:Transposase n=1 Tax=Streptomyces diastaticus subsp. diastaticus TaxID=68040 RepID=A0ABQ1CQX6_STRDI|nr:hypothetical protein Sdia_34730 [Streptomyces diastaticus subsp. diastaticus]GGU24258.1 hypothetical protein GCM10015534_28900 [Streptomyces diastaticus subsp. diastaticus]
MASRTRGTLGGKLRELRFELDGEAVRIPYWVTPGQRIVLLTVFREARMREAAEVERAHKAQKVCEAEHGHVQRTYERRKELMQHSTWRTRQARQLAVRRCSTTRSTSMRGWPATWGRRSTTVGSSSACPRRSWQSRLE